MRRVFEYFVRRLVAASITLLALILVTFLVYRAIPQDPSGFVYPLAQHLSDYQIAHANHLLGIDRSLPRQYFSYVWQLLHGDIGRYWQGAKLVNNDHLTRIPIGPALFPAVGVTISIILGGAAMVVILGVPLGVFSGSRVGTLTDRAISLGALIGICTHPMVLGLVLATFFGRHGWLPGGGYCPLVKPAAAACGGPIDWATHLLLPWSTFALLFLALYVRIIRASVADTLHEDYVRTARAKGAREGRVLFRHVLPSAGLRVLTMVGMEVSTAIGTCVYIETAFSMNGLGRTAILAMGGAEGTLDLPLALAVVTMITLFVVAANLAVDMLYAVLDPRAGEERSRGRMKVAAGGII